MKLKIFGANLRDQSKGQFVVHAADCSDCAKLENMTWSEKIDAAYAANTGAKLAKQEADRIARNDAVARNDAGVREREADALTRQEIAFLAKEEEEMDAAIDDLIKQDVRERHCSRAEAKDWLREKGLA